MTPPITSTGVSVTLGSSAYLAATVQAQLWELLRTEWRTGRRDNVREVVRELRRFKRRQFQDRRTVAIDSNGSC